jgi:hypothetical protein
VIFLLPVPDGSGLVDRGRLQKERRVVRTRQVRSRGAASSGGVHDEDGGGGRLLWGDPGAGGRDNRTRRVGSRP